MLAAVEPDARDLRDLVGELLVKSPEFVRMWERYDVAPPSEGRKTMHHPVVGDLAVGYQVMPLQGSEGQAMLTYFAEPGSPSYDQFVLLDGLAGLDVDAFDLTDSGEVDSARQDGEHS